VRTNNRQKTLGYMKTHNIIDLGTLDNVSASCGAPSNRCVANGAVLVPNTLCPAETVREIKMQNERMSA
jgi:hypothetical protein